MIWGWGAVGDGWHPIFQLRDAWSVGTLPQALGGSEPTVRGVSEPGGVSLSVALKFPLKCFFLFFKEKNIPKLENKGNSLPPNHTKLTLGAWRESMETRKPAVNPAEGWGGSWAAQARDHCCKADPKLLRGAGVGGIAQSRGGVELVLEALAFRARTTPFHSWPNLGRQERRGLYTPGRPQGIQGLGQVGEPARQLPTPCHTVESGPSPLTGFRNTQARH